MANPKAQSLQPSSREISLPRSLKRGAAGGEFTAASFAGARLCRPPLYTRSGRASGDERVAHYNVLCFRVPTGYHLVLLTAPGPSLYKGRDANS
jgi:hypothetical protein